jgi:class 3 adenylate cyclase
VALSPDASSDAFPRAPGSFGLFLLVRGLTLLTVLLVCLVGLVWVGLRLVTPQWVPASVRVGLDTGVGPATELGVLLGMLIIGMATLAGLRRWEAWAREREEALEQAREQARPRAEPTRGDVPEAVLVVDLIQSTELIRDQGDEFFRDMLRRIETAFIPVARAHGTRAVNGHGDGFLFCFERADQALEAVREMYTRLPVLNQGAASGAEVAFRASLHMGTTFPDTRGNRTGLAVLKTVRLGSVMETLHGRGAGRNCLVVSEEALAALGARGASAKLLGRVSLRGFPGTHAVYQLDV